MYIPLLILLLLPPTLFLPLLLCIFLLRRRRRRMTLCIAAKDLELAVPTAPLSPRRFTWKEVEFATANFTSDVIGNGGFSTVYLAHLPHFFAVATAKLHHSSERLRQSFRSELDVLRRLHHPHIIRLLGYCDERDDQGVLIFEFAQNGNLHEKLQSCCSGGGAAVLPWSRRTSIAYHVAQALDYLHERCELQIVHGDIKSTNILLDGDFNAKVCDFGCARVGFSAAVRGSAAVMGSPGYVDPNYIRTGLVSKKSDVYSFGVLVLVLITGAEAFDGEKERLLTAVAGKRLLEATGGEVGGIVDRSLEGDYDEKEVAVMAGISALCIGENPSLRPSMADVVALIEEKVGSAISTVDCKM